MIPVETLVVKEVSSDLNTELTIGTIVDYMQLNPFKLRLFSAFLKTWVYNIQYYFLLWLKILIKWQISRCLRIKRWNYNLLGGGKRSKWIFFTVWTNDKEYIARFSKQKQTTVSSTTFDSLSNRKKTICYCL